MRKSGFGLVVDAALGLCMVGGSMASAQTFQTPRRFALTGMSTDATGILVVADVASPGGGPDGLPDVVVAAQNQRAAVLAGKGDGTFSIEPTTTLGRIPAALAIGKLDGDDVPDMLLAETTNSVVVFRGSAAGPPFEQLGDPIQIARNPSAVALADLNKDGKLDALVVSEGAQGVGEVTILRGNGDGTFSPPPVPASSTVTVGGGSDAIAVSDFDADGNLDFAVSNSIDGTISVRLSDDQGDYSADPGSDPSTIVSGETGEPVAVAAGDMNGDDKIDLVTINRNLDQIAILDGKGDGTFLAPRLFQSGSIGSTPTGLALSDVDGDEDLDVLVPNNRSSDVSVLKNNGSGMLGPARAFMADEETLAVAVDRFDGDQIPDVVAVSKGDDSPTASVLIGDGGGALKSIENVPTRATPADVFSADMDADGFPDMVVTYGSGSVELYRSTGETFQPMVPASVTASGDPIATVARDFSGDGLIDLAVASKSEGVVRLFRRQSNGSFAAAQSFATQTGGSSAMAVADFDHDGRADLATAAQPSEGDGQVAILRSAPGGGFLAAQLATVGSTPIGIDAGDFNEDGNPDLITANNVSNDVSILLGRGDGTFDEGRFVTATGGPRDVAVADFDRDGCDDFAVALAMSRTTGIFYGNCAAGFVRGPSSLASADSPAAVVARDFNGDGLPDVAIADQVDNAVSVYTKRAGDRFFTRSSSDVFVVSRRPIGVLSADFDGDGRYDVATNNSFVAGSVSVLTNIKAALGLRGDGNSDRRVSAADLVALAREVADGDGDRVDEVRGSLYAASTGVDGDGDGVIGAHDGRAIAAWIFPRL